MTNQAKVAVVRTTIQVNFNNPLTLRRKGGGIIGCAVASIDDGGIDLEVFVDAHTPEALDLSLETGVCQVSLQGTITDTALDGHVFNGEVVVE